MPDPFPLQQPPRDTNQPIPKGKVYLIGAGPGDPGLLTLRGLKCLQKADIVLYDGLVNPAILQQIPPGTECVCVGKHGQSRVWTQPEINHAIVQASLRGQCVARLKGGDPAIFARTAEELDRLVEEGISFEVVPGITAAMAAASYAGIPITHRDWASSVAFVTGQSQAIDGGGEAEESMDWRALAQFPGTLVFYMGVTSAGAWSQHLIDAGKSPNTPTALVLRCSLPNQEILHCTLGEISQRIAESPNFRPPVITIVGTVASLGPTFDWFTHRPLFGKTVLITRPETQSDQLRQELEELGATVLIQPAIEISPLIDFCELDHAIGGMTTYDWILFTSSNGVRHFFDRLRELGQDARCLKGVQLACVGPSTSQVLREYFLRADCVPEGDYRAESLVESLRDRVAGKRCLWVRGSRGRDVLTAGLKELGATVDTVVAYHSVDRQRPEEEIRKHLEQGKIDYTIVTSGSIASSLSQLFGELLSRTRLISLSVLTSDVLRDLGHTVFSEAKTASMSDIVSAIVSHEKPKP